MLPDAFLLRCIDMVRLRIRDFVREGEYSHFARPTLDNSRFTAIHRHDFYEIFWIESGEGVHRLRGACQNLRPGDLRFIAPDDDHDFRVEAGKSMRFANFAFRTGTWNDLAKRYLRGKTDPFHDPQRQGNFHCTETERARLAEWSLDLAAGDRSRLATDRLLLNLLQIVLASPSSHPAILRAPLPEWLNRACERIREPAHFLGGPHAFTRLSGRSAEHVARYARRFLGKTPTQIVNDARLAHAERLLMESDQPVTSIAQQCGFESMTHFYELFLQRTGITPARFRRRSLEILGRRG